MKNRRFTTAFLLLLTVLGIAATVATIYIVNPDDCTNCGLCIEVCPVEAISEVEIDGKTVAMIDPEICTNCGLCEETCPVEAITQIAEEAPETKAVETEVAE